MTQLHLSFLYNIESYNLVNISDYTKNARFRNMHDHYQGQSQTSEGYTVFSWKHVDRENKIIILHGKSK